MTYQVDIRVMPLKDLLDPQGKAVLGGLASLSLSSVTDVRIGKHISLTVEAGSAEEARSIAEEASKRLLANPVMESFEVTVTG
ncbi:MAG: phosphoribosylformylglycinamidine synthase subunit PurS [Chitinophagia bacterium]|nr:phosphoribosylformylglycinamidine synthase subunit PurS [Chitinophagia bacterium]